jgi:glyoxylate reductase
LSTPYLLRAGNRRGKHGPVLWRKHYYSARNLGDFIIEPFMSTIISTAPKFHVVATRKLPDAVEVRLSALFPAKLNINDTPLTRQALVQAVQTSDVLVPTITDHIDAEIIEAAGEKLKLIANFGVGIDHIDLKAAAEHDIAVTNTPGVLTEDTADLTFALMLAVPRRLFEGMHILEQGGFTGWYPTWMMGRRLGGMRLGIVGMGRIGQAVARRAKAFGMEINYHNRREVGEAVAKTLGAIFWRDLDDMLAQMDMVILTCPRTAETYHLMSAERMKRMKPSAYLINTARGDIVDEHALALALESGALAGAGLDVFENEPQVDETLLKLNNVVLLPHMGSGTLEARTAMGMKMVANIEAFAKGHDLPDRVGA